MKKSVDQKDDCQKKDYQHPAGKELSCAPKTVEEKHNLETAKADAKLVEKLKR